MYKKYGTLLVVLSLLLTLFCACSPSGSTVMTIGDSQISSLEYNYIYNEQILDFCDAYADYLSYFGLDPEKPLTEQDCLITEVEQTWAEFFLSRAEEMLTQVYCFYNAATDAGVSLDETSRLQLDGFVLAAKEAAEKANQTPDEYLAERYGEGMTQTRYEEFLSRRILASQYCNEILDAVVFTENEYEAFYAENRDAIDRVTFRVFTFTEDHLTETYGSESETVAAIQAKAQSFADRVVQESDFGSLALEYSPEDEKGNYQSDSATLAKNISQSDLADGEMNDWLFNASRKAGDIAVHKTATAAYTVCYFVSRGRDESNLVSMRHLLLKVSAEEGKSDAEVLARINQLYAQWNEEGQTEESFLALVEAYTEDPGSATTGGLYENFAQGTMVSEIDDWLFAADRKRGDSAVIKTVHGYHIVWFVGFGEISWKYECRSGLQDEKYYEFYDEYAALYPVTFAENYLKILGIES